MPSPDFTSLPHFTLLAPPPRPSQPSLASAWREALSTLPPRVADQFEVLEGRLDDAVKQGRKVDCLVSPANSFGIMDGGYDMALSRLIQENGDAWTLTKLVQAHLRTHFRGFLPPGGCTIVPLPECFLPPPASSSSPIASSSNSLKIDDDSNDLKTDVDSTIANVKVKNPLGASSIAVLPTMRIPERMDWHKDLVYDGVWNLLLAISHYNHAITHSHVHAHDDILQSRSDDEKEGQREREGRKRKIERVLMTGLGTGKGGVSASRCAGQMVKAIENFVKGWDVADGEGPRWSDVGKRVAELDALRDP